MATHANPSTKPFAIICGNQTGTDKSILHNLNYQKNQNTVTIDASNFHRFHPHFKALQDKHGAEYLKHTQDFADNVALGLIKRLSDQKYNLLIDTPLMEPFKILDSCKFLKEQAYSVEFNALAMTRDELWQSTLKQSETAKHSGFLVQKSTKREHNAMLYKALEGISQIAKAKEFDKIALFTQDQQCIYNSLDTPNVNPRVMLHNDVLNNENEITRNHKDEFFRDLFKDKENFVDLYKACSGEELSPDDITPFSLDSSLLTRPLENDVSFLTKDNKLIVFVEHQSTDNSNMALRGLLYYAESVRLWLSQNEKKLTNTTKIDVPLPQFYVAYNGTAELKQNIQEFGNDFINVKSKVIDVNFDKLENQENDNVLAGYAYFYKEMRSEYATNLTPEEAMNYAREQCIDKGYLKGVIDKEDFVSMYSLISKHEEERRGYLKEGEAIGIKKGEAIGVKKGRVEGVKFFADLLEKNGVKINKNDLDKIMKQLDEPDKKTQSTQQTTESKNKTPAAPKKSHNSPER